MFVNIRLQCRILVFFTGPPSSPENLERSFILDDLRPGFDGHAVIGLQWVMPVEGRQLAMSNDKK